jgi:TRAP-type transport system small permease protein
MRAIYRLTKYMGYVGAALIAIMMMMTVVDVFMRFVFNSPIAGVNELSALSLAMVVGLGFGWAALERAHIKVDLVMDRLPKETQFITDAVMFLLSLIMGAIMMIWTLVDLIGKKGQTTGSLHIPLVPFEWIFWAGLLVFVICILILVIEHFPGKDK